MFCPQCGKANNDSARFCLNCGNALSQTIGDTPLSLTAETSPATDEFYKAAIGPKNQDYYLRHFAHFDSAGKIGVSWHWPAFFVSFYWLLYRKMWLNALIYFFLPYFFMFLVGFAAAVGGGSSDTIIGIGYLVYWAAIIVLPPLYANALYYKHCKSKILEVRASSDNVQRQLGELSAKGGTSNVAVIILLMIFVFVAIIGILAAIALPAYQDYLARARLTEAMGVVGAPAKVSVAEYYEEHRQFPNSLEQAGLPKSLPPSVKAISIDSENGTVTITMATAPVEGKSLLLVPSVDANNQMTWQCRSQDIPDRYLPRQCRQQK